MCHGATVRTYSSDRRAISAFPKRTAGRYTPPLSRRKIQRGRLPAPAQSSASGTSDQLLPLRSEERRVGKECRSRWWPEHEKKKKTQVGAMTTGMKVSS